MLTSKQRSKLRALASNIAPVYQLGKQTAGENFDADFLKGVGEALEARELIKITVLKNSEFKARELGDSLAQAVGAECVATIGSKIVLYKKSGREGVKHIEL